MSLKSMLRFEKKNIVSAASIIIAIFTILGGLWAVENHYETKAEAKEKIEKVEIQVAQALQTQQIRTDYQFYQFMYDKLTQEMYSIKRQLKRNPEDTDLREEYNDIKIEREKIKNKMRELMEKIK
jgi:uncharacterized coiled-coil DUF342 family protein